MGSKISTLTRPGVDFTVRVSISSNWSFTLTNWTIRVWFENHNRKIIRCRINLRSLAVGLNVKRFDLLDVYMHGRYWNLCWKIVFNSMLNSMYRCFQNNFYCRCRKIETEIFHRFVCRFAKLFLWTMLKFRMQENSSLQYLSVNCSLPKLFLVSSLLLQWIFVRRFHGQTRKARIRDVIRLLYTDAIKIFLYQLWL